MDPITLSPFIPADSSDHDSTNPSSPIIRGDPSFSPFACRSDNAVQFTPPRKDTDHITCNAIDNLMKTWELKVADIPPVKAEEFRKRLEDSLHQQMHDGSITYLQYLDLKRIVDLWVRLASNLQVHFVGSRVGKREIIDILLELYNLKQMSYEELIDLIFTL